MSYLAKGVDELYELQRWTSLQQSQSQSQPAHVDEPKKEASKLRALASFFEL